MLDVKIQKHDTRSGKLRGLLGQTDRKGKVSLEITYLMLHPGQEKFGEKSFPSMA